MSARPRALAAFLSVSTLALMPRIVGADPQSLEEFLDQRLYGQADAPENSGDRERHAAIFARLDADGSGGLDEEELQGLHWVDVVEPLARLGLPAAVVTAAEGHEPRTDAQRLVLGIALVQRDRGRALEQLRSGTPWAEDGDLAAALTRAESLLAAVAAEAAEPRPAAARAYLRAIDYLVTENRSLAAQKAALRPRDAGRGLVLAEIETLWDRDQGTNLEQAILAEARGRFKDVGELVEAVDGAAQAIARRADGVDAVGHALDQAELDLEKLLSESPDLATALSGRLEAWDGRKALLLDAPHSDPPENALQQLRYIFTHLDTLKESDDMNRRFVEWLAGQPQAGALEELIEFLLPLNQLDSATVTDMVELLESLPADGGRGGAGGGR